MDVIVSFFVALFKLIFNNIFSILSTYLILLLAIRLFRIWKIKRLEPTENQGFKTKNTTRPLKIINICPRCGSSCKRIERSTSDKIRTVLSANLMQWKRYHCYNCYWEGSRW